MSAQLFLLKCGLNDLIISKPGHSRIYVSDVIQIFLDSAEHPPLESEKEWILRALAENGYRIDKTSAALGMSPNTLYRKRKKYGIT